MVGSKFGSQNFSWRPVVPAPSCPRYRRPVVPAPSWQRQVGGAKLTAPSWRRQVVPDRQARVIFADGGVRIIGDDELVATADWEGNSAIVKCKVVREAHEEVNAALQKLPPSKDYDVWHKRLGHAPAQQLLVHKKLLNGFSLERNLIWEPQKLCEGCVMGKMKKLPFPRTGRIAKAPLDLIHSDVMGPMSVATKSGGRYMLSFMDDHSRWARIFILKSKSEVFECFKDFQADVEALHGKKIRALHTDNGGEFCSLEFETYLKEQGIRHQKTVPYCPQQNGVAESRNRLVTNMGMAMLADAGLPKSFWGEAASTAVHIQNRTHSRATKTTPYKRWRGRKPDVSYFKVFGCAAYALKPEQEQSKFSGKGERCVMLGYERNVKGYRLWNLEKGKLQISRDVQFDEHEFPCKKKPVYPDMEAGTGPCAPRTDIPPTPPS